MDQTTQQNQPTQPTQIDPQVKNLVSAIGHAETGPSSPDAYTQKGASGEFGRYQFMPDTWKMWAGQHLGDENAAPTVENQNKVAYEQVKQWKDQGLNPAQIASKWNSGNENAYKEGHKGVNAEGVAYDTPAYTQKVSNYYNQLKTQGTTSPAPTETTSQDNQPKTFLGKAINFAFPVVRDLINDVKGQNDKTALQQLGDAGMSALWFVPFGDVAEGAGLGLKALGAGEKTAQAGGAIATGLGTGYAGDVASNLSQGKTGGQAVTPGLGTVIGGGLGAAGVAAGGLYNKFAGQQSTIDKVTGAYEDALGATKSGIKATSKVAARGGDTPAEFLANAGLPPETAEINGRRVFTTGEDSNTYKTIQQRATDLTDLRDQAIEKAGTSVTSDLETLRQQALKEADNQFSGTARDSIKAHINSEFDAYVQQFSQDGKNVSLTDLNTIKKDLQGKSNYDATRPSQVTQANQMMANLTKTQVENEATKAGVPGIKALNKIIQQHLDFLNTGGKKGILNKLNGQVVKGGRIGTHINEAIGASIGTGASKRFGGGLMGDIIGGLAGAGAGNLVSKWLQKFAVGGKMTAATIGRMAKQDPEVVQNFLKYLDREGEQIAPNVVPKQKSAAEVFTGLLKKSPGSKIKQTLKT